MLGRMTFARPTLAEIVARIEADVSSRLGVGPLLERGPLKVLSRVMGGASHSLHGHLDYNARQAVPLTAEATVLESWADLYGLERLAATKANGEVTVTGLNGTSVPLGAQLGRADGSKYRTTSTAVVAGGTATVTAEAEVAGRAGNAAAGTELSFTIPVAGLTSAVVAAGGLLQGEDRETDEQLRARLRARQSAAPQGGSVADFEAWTLEVAGVTRAWVFPAMSGLGTVGVTFAVDDDPTGPIPSPAEVAAVLARLTDPTRRDSAPVTAEVIVYAAVELPVDFTIELNPDTAAVRAAVEANLRDLILRDGAPGGTLLLSRIREAISTAAGEADHELTVPAANVVATVGELPVLGTITWA